MDNSKLTVKYIDGEYWINEPDLLAWMYRVAKAYPSLTAWHMFQSLKVAMYEFEQTDT